MILTRDDAFIVVFNLRTPVNGKEDVGTGMFLAKDDEVYMITATHVAKATHINTIVAFGDRNSNCISMPLIKFNNYLQWIHHPIADISILKVNLNMENYPYLHNRCFPYDHCNLSSNSVSRDVELTTIGFPNGLGIYGKFSPLTFRSYASSSFLTLLRGDTETPSEFFCLENPSIGGYSGGPVFDLGYIIVGTMTTTKDKTICHGIIHGTMSDNTGGKIALVTPIQYLRYFFDRK